MTKLAEILEDMKIETPELHQLLPILEVTDNEDFGKVFGNADEEDEDKIERMYKTEAALLRYRRDY